VKDQYTAVLKQKVDWWIGWIAEVPGENCQEQRRQRMKLSYLWCVPMIAMIALSVFAGEPSLPYPADPETKKAIGAKEMTAAELKKTIDAGEPVLVIEVRDASFYEKETIPGAIHIPFANLQEALKEIPKDRTLVFT
jgi:hypothetical protein